MLLGAPGLTTRSKDATRAVGPRLHSFGLPAARSAAEAMPLFRTSGSEAMLRRHQRRGSPERAKLAESDGVVWCGIIYIYMVACIPHPNGAWITMVLAIER